MTRMQPDATAAGNGHRVDSCSSTQPATTAVVQPSHEDTAHLADFMHLGDPLARRSAPVARPIGADARDQEDHLRVAVPLPSNGLTHIKDLDVGLASPSPPPTRPVSWTNALLRNVWVLAIITGIVAVVLVAKDRLHVPEPLQYVHAANSAQPYMLALPNTNIDFLYVTTTVSPWQPPDGQPAAGHRRRLLSQQALAAAVAASGAGQAGHAGSTEGVYTLQAQRQLKQLLKQPRRALATANTIHKRRLQQEPVPTNTSSSGALPQLHIALYQANACAAAAPQLLPPSLTQLPTAVISPQALGFTRVSGSQFCETKDGRAVKCNLDFQADALNAAFVAGQRLYLGFSIDKPGQAVFRVHASEIGWLGRAKNWLAFGIIVLMLIGIATERVHRMWCAFMAAAAMMGVLLWMNMAPALEQVTEWLDESTLGLLFGMMMIVGQLKDTGLFEVLAASTMRACKGRMWLLSVMMFYITGFVSAFLDNVTTMLLMGPITISMMATCNVDPRPMLVAQALMSNIGGTATLVGDPPNIIIGTALQQYIGFVDFIIHLAPGVIFASVPATGVILWLYKGSLTGPISNYSKVVEAANAYRIKDKDLFAKCMYVTGVVLLGFLLHSVHHFDPAWFALLGAVVLCVITHPMDVESVLHAVEWDMLLFFAGQFIMVEAAAEIGLIDMIGGWLEAIIKAAPADKRTLVAIEILLWASAAISAVLDNIPYTITMVPVIEYLAGAGLGLDLQILAWALAFGACFGGNATLIGASANIVTATMLDRNGTSVSFVKWMYSGVPVTLVSVAIANVYMLLRYVL